MKDDEQLDVDSDANLIVSNEASLIISQSRITDSGNYSCLAQNVAARRRSETARLIVNGSSTESISLFYVSRNYNDCAATKRETVHCT